MSSGKDTDRPGFSRREALRYLGSASALPLVYPALSRPAPSWHPRFLRPGDVDTVARLAECIIPGIRVAGTRDVAMLAYIDTSLARAEPAIQASFHDGLSWLNDYVFRSTRRRFTELDVERQHRLLADISDTSRSHEPVGYAFLTQIKQLTIDAYYRSSSV